MIQISSVEVRVAPDGTAPRAPGEAGGSPTSWARTARTVIAACRPRQWSKNALLVAAPLAGGVIADADVTVRVAAAIVAFCMLSSATYLLNDVRDVAQDRLHPRKRLRPIAAGTLGIRAALVRLEFLAVGCGYLLLTAAYSLWLRHIVVIDILAIAAGFVLRAAAGGAAADVPLSRWFLVVTSCSAVFIVAGKRHAELFGQARDGLTRVTLLRYSARTLRAVMALAAAGTVVAYGIWAFRRPEHGPWYEVSIIPVVIWLARYAELVGRGAGEAPEDLILIDRALLVLTVAWTALFVAGLYVGR